MHWSRLAGFIIDCRTQDLPAAARFWGDALGLEVRELPGEGGQYIELANETPALHIEVQSVTHPSRVHLDIETDDVEAEVRRLEGLGAKRVRQVKTWWVMRAPSGQKFCVIRSKDRELAKRANEWQ
jgi:catechol 2,3-dioxygenase-like lactoylglutathione lyase family enzyme